MFLYGVIKKLFYWEWLFIMAILSVRDNFHHSSKGLGDIHAAIILNTFFYFHINSKSVTFTSGAYPGDEFCLLILFD